MALLLLRTWVVMSIGWIGLCFLKMRGQHIFGDRFTPDEFVAAAALPPLILLIVGSLTLPVIGPLASVALGAAFLLAARSAARVSRATPEPAFVGA